MISSAEVEAARRIALEGASSGLSPRRSRRIAELLGDALAGPGHEDGRVSLDLVMTASEVAATLAALRHWDPSDDADLGEVAAALPRALDALLAAGAGAVED